MILKPKHNNRLLLRISVIIVYLASISAIIIYYMKSKEYFASGNDIWGHIFKSDLMFKSIKNGDFYPLYTELWYNGLQPYRMNLLTILFALIWIYILTVLTRCKLDFWKYCWGSVGLFILLMALLEPIILDPLTKAVASVSGLLGELTDMYNSYFQYGILFISNFNSSISLYIDYECSGVIEIMAFTSLLWFFNVYTISEKVVINIIGFMWIFIANVLRIFIICSLIYFFGNNIFYFAHTIFGRLVFYAFSIALYFFVFTKSHILHQKVGSFNYEHN